MPDPKVVMEVSGREVIITNPDKIYFPPHGGRPAITKLDIVRYYLAVADGALRGIAGRPMVLKRFVNGAGGEAFFQKRAPARRPDWIGTAEFSYPSGRTADEVVVTDAAGLAWVANLGCIDLNPHPVRAADIDHPDELRVDLDPIPGVPYQQVLDVALVAREVLADCHLTAWPKTSGSRGFHIYAPILPRWTFAQVRACAAALAREIERRAPDLATSRWWKEERHGVFVDYNQNARDRTVASAYSLRPVPQARVSAPLTWDEVPGCDPDAFTIDTIPERFARMGDPWAEMAQAAGSLEPLLEAEERDRRDGSAEAGEADRPAFQATSGRRRTTMPLIEVARSASRDDAFAGLGRWKARHPEAAAFLEPADILVDAMRGRSSTWTRIRLNLRHVPRAQRPPQEELDVDYDPWDGTGDPRRPPREPRST
jgi:bifunctional non-homologous end joining protein LigD